MNFKTLDIFHGYKLIQDSTFDDPMYCILNPSNTVIGESTDEHKVINAWVKFKAASMDIAH